MSARVALLRTFVVWVIVWPLVTLGLFVLQTAWPDLPMPARTLVLTALLVPAISLIIAPQVARRVS
ncbi:hypothetical protein BCF33_1281 [Hasllibacter halocynthiae]|uniref:Uncharacterized protein n=1 Tax=Hasllibacter halocynthiae TaxID=595589 RepID=A0A2T0X9Q3_9RHOB|nr:hypothetical protein [Hasllibacter halocynthiae]PRY95659.1 hypothetical protein BCF33_1281 [Hasllibacter halocynthiae]